VNHLTEALAAIGCLVLVFGFLVPYWRIFGRLGCHPALALLMWVPLINFGVLYYVAYSNKAYPAGKG